MDNINEKIFGRIGGLNRQLRRGKNLMYQFNVTLEDLYQGNSKRFAIEKNVICDKCNGKGGMEVQKCPVCKGMGVEVHLKHLGLGLVQKSQTTCYICHGEGEAIKDICKKCEGRKVVREKKILDIYIVKGMSDGQQIKFSGEGHQEPGIEPGDIIVILEEKPHNCFTRKNSDLLYIMKLDLIDTLCGFKRTITTLDNRTLLIETKPGEFNKYLEYRAIKNEGMPNYKNPDEHGQLIIKFEFVFPDNLSLLVDKLQMLRSILPPSRFSTSLDNLKDAKKCVLQSYDPNMGDSNNKDPYSRQRNDEGGIPGESQRVQCTSN